MTQITDETKIISQLDLEKLTERYSNEQIENALISIFIKERSIVVKKNRLISSVIKRSNKTIASEVTKYLKLKKIALNLMTIEKLFELLLEEAQKLKYGSFYTPHFVVDFIVDNSISKDSNVVDMCCGCGAFLMGAAKKLVNITGKRFINIIENNIYGVDISKQSINKAKIMLTLLALINGEDKEHINFNLLVADSLSLNWNKAFPNIFSSGGFDAVIGNPPYTKYHNAHEYSNNNTYLLFIELMMNISKRNDSMCGVIIPLSLAYNSNRHYVLIRKMLMESNVKCYISFYDRSPDSLFGDNIKTRNAILFIQREKQQEYSMSTTKLIRWNSKLRHKLFDKTPYLNIGDYSIEKGVPKISSAIEFDSLKALKSNDRFMSIILQFNRPKMADRLNDNCLYIYSTAYNWLPVFRDIPVSKDSKGKRIIPNSLYKATFKDKRDASLAYAILNSKIVYWYWLVWGDGFHVNRNFISDIPISPSSLSNKARNILSALGDKLWRHVRKYPIYKVNKNIKIGNYNIIKGNAIINKIDRIIISEMALKPVLLRFLENRYYENISAGRNYFKNRDLINAQM